jgi:hypothetical protein
MKRFAAATLIALGAFGRSEAQVQNLVDQSYYVASYVDQTFDFSIAAPSTFIAGLQSFDPGVFGIGLLYGPGSSSPLDAFAITDSSSSPAVFSLATPGDYSFFFDAINTDAATNDGLAADVNVLTPVTIVPVPEPSSYALLAAGLLLLAIAKQRARSKGARLIKHRFLLPA